jgi:hypothetical protein
MQNHPVPITAHTANKHAAITFSATADASAGASSALLDHILSER